MHELALFAGVGGGLLATKHLLGWRTVCYIEHATYPVEVLKARIRDGLLDDAPIWGDARTFDGYPWAGCVDIVTAGFPCQPFSQAGKQRGEHDPRNMWPDTIRIIREVGPRYALLENVPRLLSHQYFGRILGDLAESGYDAQWDCISASAVGANHQRDRLWIVAHAASKRRREAGQHRPAQSEERAARCSQEMAHPNSGRLQERTQLHCEPTDNPPIRSTCGRHAGGRSDEVANPNSERLLQSGSDRSWQAHSSTEPPGHGRTWWAVEPPVGRVVDGCPDRVGQLKALGNTQVPAVVAVVWRLLGDWVLQQNRR